jgi:Protein prenyltransferase alpha subunit repeat
MLLEINGCNERFKAIMADEFNICDKAGGRHASNYHAWDYRRFLLVFIKDNAYLLAAEYKLSREWCFAHVNDCSGWSYRKSVLLVSASFEDEIESCRALLDVAGDINIVLKHVAWADQARKRALK